MNLNNYKKAISFFPKKVSFPLSWLGHAPFMYWLADRVKPKIFVELGTHSGNSYFSFCQSVSENDILTECYAIDSWFGDEHSGKYSDDIFNDVHNYNNLYYKNFSKLIRKDFNDAVNDFKDNSIDILHIDGFHSYEAVANDFYTWLPKLSREAIIIFHDTNVMLPGFGVHKFWNEIVSQYPRHFNFTHSHGLGVLQLNNPQDNDGLDFFSGNTQTKDELIHFFYHLGEKILKFAEVTFAYQLQANEIEEEKLYIEKLSDELNGIKNSRSWAITRPLRLAKKAAHVFGTSPFNFYLKSKSSVTSKTFSRNEILLGYINPKGTGLEIGPSYNPVASKKDGYNVTIVDHLNTKSLRKKYLEMGINVENIEDVDVVWHSGSLLNAVQKPSHFDYIIASHLLEHIPNPILFLKDCNKLLKSDGVLVLALPDMRFCFDIYKPISNSGDWIEAFIEEHTFHPPRKHYYHYAYSAKKGDKIAWDINCIDKLSIQGHSLSSAYHHAKDQFLNKSYKDIHGWFFTPESINLIFAELKSLNLIDFDIINITPTIGCEFFLSLKKSSTNESSELAIDARNQLLNRAYKNK
jgi:predicted SAM-dependent methyltransferase